jgi:hypothetical protein
VWVGLDEPDGAREVAVQVQQGHCCLVVLLYLGELRVMLSWLSLHDDFEYTGSQR